MQTHEKSRAEWFAILEGNKKIRAISPSVWMKNGIKKKAPAAVVGAGGAVAFWRISYQIAP